MNYEVMLIKPFGANIKCQDPSMSVYDIDVEHLRELFAQHHLLLLRGFQGFSTAQDFAQYCEQWGEVSEWPFGKVLELVEHDDPKDHIFDHRYVPLHWDGMYRRQIPEYQIFHCVKAPLAGQGGRTTFTNTQSVLEQAQPELKQCWSKVTGVYEREMEFYNSKTVSPIICQHPYKEYSVIRYNEPPAKEKGHFINPPKQQFIGIDEQQLDEFHRLLQAALHAPNHFYAHEWQTGDVVIADNFTLLHGREAFVSQSPRHIRRVHVLSSPAFDNPGLESYQ